MLALYTVIFTDFENPMDVWGVLKRREKERQ